MYLIKIPCNGVMSRSLHFHFYYQAHFSVGQPEMFEIFYNSAPLVLMNLALLGHICPALFYQIWVKQRVFPMVRTVSAVQDHLTDSNGCDNSKRNVHLYCTSTNWDRQGLPMPSQAVWDWMRQFWLFELKIVSAPSWNECFFEIYHLKCLNDWVVGIQTFTCWSISTLRNM